MDTSCNGFEGIPLAFESNGHELLLNLMHITHHSIHCIKLVIDLKGYHSFLNLMDIEFNAFNSLYKTRN